eukprot:1159889-Pelagomonas_calceolata.AAC.7
MATATAAASAAQLSLPHLASSLQRGHCHSCCQRHLAVAASAGHRPCRCAVCVTQHGHCHSCCQRHAAVAASAGHRPCRIERNRNRVGHCWAPSLRVCCDTHTHILLEFHPDCCILESRSEIVNWYGPYRSALHLISVAPVPVSVSGFLLG